MEAKLKEYRDLRRRKELTENAMEKIEKSKEKIVNFSIPNIFSEKNVENQDEVALLEREVSTNTSLLIQPEETVDLTSEVSELESFEDDATQESWRYFILKWTIYFLIWITFYILFLRLQFGAVYFVFSVLIGIYLNTRTRPKKKGEVSAYSVFNENCVSIDGTLTAEQFEKEIRFGPGSVR